VGVVPVLVGAAASGHPIAVRTAGALAVALGLQVGANYANDYFDGVRGVDTRQRIGPKRLVAGGSASPRSVLTAAAISFMAAGVIGVSLAVASGQEELIALGALAMLGAVLYTGGPRPYAGIGVADVAVFLFFGLFATCGTTAVEIGRVTSASWWAAVPVGLLAAAVLIANNLRDAGTDAAAGRRTLIVRLGVDRGRTLYEGVVAGALAVPPAGILAGGLPVQTLAVLLCIPAAIPALRLVRRASGRELVPALIATTRLHLAVGLVLAAALAVAAWTA
jgi:1,4-dihydroxy-2-naphthoate octaprenyltransferase